MGVDSEKVMLQMARKLSCDQMVVFGIMVDHAKRILVCKASNSLVDLDPPVIIVHGGGGVGKSFLINCVAKWIEKILRKPGDHPLKPKILILGPTGMAAYLIGHN